MATGDPNNVPSWLPPARKAPEHLNNSGLRIEYAEGKGRGVYACREIPAQTLVEVSPVLLFTAAEYEAHGKHTVLDHYTFVWRDGRMALALGLGSLFNHSQKPNVSYTIDPCTESIRYVTSRQIMPDEEMCIFYGHKLWFDPVDAADNVLVEPKEEQDDGWGGLTGVEDQDIKSEGALTVLDAFSDGDPNEVIPEEQLPFKRIRLTPDEEEEEDMDAVRREDAWVVDLPDPRITAVMLKWLKQNGMDLPSMSHLKRVRKVGDQMSMVLVLTREHPTPPSFPEHIELPAPYILSVPKTSALTMTSLKLKTSLWPTIYTPRKKYEPEPWTRGKIRWACKALRKVVSEAQLAGEEGELPIAAHVPVPYDEETRIATRMQEPISAHDTRKSALHPLRHPIINLVRAVGELRALLPPQPSTPLPVEAAPGQLTDQPPATSTDLPEARNGAHYLLTSLTLFTTHEPCIMCSMALLHSRVKEVFYLLPMAKTGGCGGLACVPRLEGVNHRYAINAWKLDGQGGPEVWAEQCGLGVEDACDA